MLSEVWFLLFVDIWVVFFIEIVECRRYKVFNIMYFFFVWFVVK